jgi:PAS domain S-box-containing protein
MLGRIWRPSLPWLPTASVTALTAVVAAVGAVASLGVGAVLAKGQREGADVQMDRRTTVVTDAVRAETGRYVDTLRTVAASLGSHDALTAEQFAHTTDPLTRMGLAGATSLDYFVPVADDDVAAAERLWRTRGAHGLVLNPHRGVDEHIFSIFNRPLDGARPATTGVDATQAAAPTNALLEARRSGLVTVSDTYRLIRDQWLPASQRQLSFVLAAPVYGPAPSAGRARPLHGWVVMGLRGQDFVGATLKRIAQGAVDVTLRARNTDDTLTDVASLRATTDLPRDLHRHAEVQVGQRRWHLIVDAAAATLPGANARMPVATVGVGLALSALLTVLVLALATGRARAEARVRAATADLSASEAEARRQAGLLESVMASISDGVAVMDGDGRFVMYNPAAQRIVGITADDAPTDNWQDRYELLTLAGTPVDPQDLPLIRALRGESADAVELVFRHTNRDESVTIGVSARPLCAKAGLTGAVAVYHDITDRKRHEAELAAAAARLAEELGRRRATESELRQQKAELSAFAGIVAHDLKSPLAGIAAYAEAAEDELRDGRLEPEPLRAMLARITAGTARMAALIDDLLAYATARDAALQPAEVDLGTLLDDVVAGKIERSVAAGRPRPDVYVGPLPAVQADPTTVRQLMTNLIGNAIKYAGPGQAARVDVTGRRHGAWVHLDIADRGMGIPAGQHKAIFNSFHRAHHGVAVAGTGLGLAICERVVIRHGGTITAADNPGGGAIFRLTLPAGAPDRMPTDRSALVLANR